jgi:Bestrophin, RFP-TM, chloride channel
VIDRFGSAFVSIAFVLACLAAFHLQAAIYNNRKPPAFGSYPQISCLERARERLYEPTIEELGDQLDEMADEIADEDMTRLQLPSMPLPHSPFPSLLRKRRNKNSELPMVQEDVSVKSPAKTKTIPSLTVQASNPVCKSINAVPYDPTANLEKQLRSRKKSKSFTQLFMSRSSSNLQERSGSNLQEDAALAAAANAPPKTPKLDDMQAATASHIHVWDKNKPPLFLQEAAHLLSLLSAVAFSTLRNDLEHAASPLITFVPGAPWPHVDPDAYTADVRKDWDNTEHRFVAVIRYISGWSRTKKARTLYNAARPFRVIGGVSDSEIELLQAARGALAKVALVTMWLQEFLVRESLAGSTGNVPSPLLSRLYQYVSDGMIGYHQAHKVAVIPFPFPHAQITSLFVIIVVALMPVLMLSYVTNAAFGFTLNLFTVMCFVGLHEVARELENPFQNVPNDVPLNNFQAQYNEALLSMFTGYHPDAFWEVVLKQPSVKDESETDHGPSEVLVQQ